MSSDAVQALAEGRGSEELTEVDQAVARLARSVAAGAANMRPEDLDELRSLRFAEDEILDVVLAAAARCFFSTVLDAVGAEPDAAYRALDAPLREALTVGRPIADA
jgi:alkylhydroperoxidase family enzyme